MRNHHSLCSIDQDINTLRKRMNNFSEKVDCLTDSRLVHMSQELDRKLNQRDRLLRRY